MSWTIFLNLAPPHQIAGMKKQRCIPQLVPHCVVALRPHYIRTNMTKSTFHIRTAPATILCIHITFWKASSLSFLMRVCVKNKSKTCLDKWENIKIKI
jgi:hypothetical protein